MNQGNDEETVKAELGRLNREYLLKTQQYDSIFEEQQQVYSQCTEMISNHEFNVIGLV